MAKKPHSAKLKKSCCMQKSIFLENVKKLDLRTLKVVLCKKVSLRLFKDSMILSFARLDECEMDQYSFSVVMKTS